MHRVNASANSIVMSRTICVIAAVLLGLCLQSECAFVKLEVQLAISDDTFSSFGTIYGHVEENVSDLPQFFAYPQAKDDILYKLTPETFSCAFAVTAVQQTDLGEARVHCITAQSFCRSCGTEWVSLVGRSSMLLTHPIIVVLLQDLHLSLGTFYKIYMLLQICEDQGLKQCRTALWQVCIWFRTSKMPRAVSSR